MALINGFVPVNGIIPDMRRHTIFFLSCTLLLTGNCKKEPVELQGIKVSHHLTEFGQSRYQIVIEPEVTMEWYENSLRMNKNAQEKVVENDGWFIANVRGKKILIPGSFDVKMTNQTADFIFVSRRHPQCPVNTTKAVFLLYEPEQIFPEAKCGVVPISENHFQDLLTDKPAKVPVIFFFSQNIRFRG